MVLKKTGLLQQQLSLTSQNPNEFTIARYSSNYSRLHYPPTNSQVPKSGWWALGPGPRALGPVGPLIAAAHRIEASLKYNSSCNFIFSCCNWIWALGPGPRALGPVGPLIAAAHWKEALRGSPEASKSSPAVFGPFTQRLPKALRGSQGLPAASRGSQGLPAASRGSRGLPEASRGSQGASRGFQRLSEVPRGFLRLPEAPQPGPLTLEIFVF